MSTKICFSVPFLKDSVIESVNEVLNTLNIAQRQALDLEAKNLDFINRGSFLLSEHATKTTGNVQDWTNGISYRGYTFDSFFVVFGWAGARQIFLHIDEVNKKIDFQAPLNDSYKFIMHSFIDAFDRQHNIDVNLFIS